jgi:hypothetical protein
MTGISLHMQWPLTSQLHGSVSQRRPWVINLQTHLVILVQVDWRTFDPLHVPLHDVISLKVLRI